jgi:hypothetical protein
MRYAKGIKLRLSRFLLGWFGSAIALFVGLVWECDRVSDESWLKTSKLAGWQSLAL